MPSTPRPYRRADRNACLNLFDSNTLDFFLPHERAEFAQWLDISDGCLVIDDAGKCEYLVIENAGQVVACGGIWQEDHAELTWGMVLRECQHQGFGSALLVARLKRLRELGANEVYLDTTFQSAPFYTQHGFEEIRHVLGGYGPGIGRVQMRARLD